MPKIENPRTDEDRSGDVPVYPQDLSGSLSPEGQALRSGRSPDSLALFATFPFRSIETVVHL
jgi:hypothetical protein